MASNSCGVVCTKGQLTFCRNGQQSPIAVLSELPVTVTLTLLRDTQGCILVYRVSQAGDLSQVSGRRVITGGEGEGGSCGKLPEGGEQKDLEEDGGLVVFPVFTVSQRVKMQFPVAIED